MKIRGSYGTNTTYWKLGNLVRGKPGYSCAGYTSMAHMIWYMTYTINTRRGILKFDPQQQQQAELHGSTIRITAELLWGSIRHIHSSTSMTHMHLSSYSASRYYTLDKTNPGTDMMLLGYILGCSIRTNQSALHLRHLVYRYRQAISDWVHTCSPHNKETKID